MSGFQVRTLLFPTDFSECARHAGGIALELARQHAARVHVLHVDPPVTAPAAPERLAEVATRFGPDLEVTTATTNGVPARAICAYARRIGADLIVIGTHGRTGVSHALLGSVAEAVVRRAPCPVLTVRAVESAPVPASVHAPSGNGHCVACGRPSLDLLCEACRTIIRGDGPGPRREPQPTQREAR